MGENYIHINDIVSVDMGNGRRETSAEYQICILGMNRKTVVGILSKLLEHMEISPLEILLYRDSHNSSDDRNTGFKIVPEFLEFIDGLGTEGTTIPLSAAEPLTAPPPSLPPAAASLPAGESLPFAQGSLWRTRNDGHKKSPPVQEHRRAA